MTQATLLNQNTPAITLEEIWNGLSDDQFLPYFQPKVAMLTKRLLGMEALIRWHHPAHGLLSAGAFLPLIEDNFLFDDLTALMLEKSLLQCQRWSEQSLDLSLAVNLSPNLLTDADLPARIESKSRSFGVAPDQVTIEVPEIALTQGMERSLENLTELRARGFGLAVDDFGSGDCPTEQLERVPMSELKIDHRVVNGALRRPHLRRLLEESLETARSLNLRVVAVGVEDQDQWELVKDLGCDMAQGYIIARPMPAEQVVEWQSKWAQSLST